MTTLALSYSKIYKIFPEINWKIVLLAGITCSMLSLVFYAWQINEITKATYFSGSYQQKITKLSQENNGLLVSFAENSFLGYASLQAEIMNFQKTTSVKYIRITDNSLAIVK